MLVGATHSEPDVRGTFAVWKHFELLNRARRFVQAQAGHADSPLIQVAPCPTKRQCEYLACVTVTLEADTRRQASSNHPELRSNAYVQDLEPDAGLTAYEG
jgi:hypothetical protein